MTVPRKPKFPFLQVEWLDHSTGIDVPFDQRPEQTVILSRGWLLAEDDNWLILGHNMNYGDAQGDRTTIHKALVVRRRTLKV